MAIALPDELQESESPCTNRALRAVCGRSLIFGNLPANHRASEYALEGPGRPIRVPGELQESEGLCTNRALRAVCGRSLIFNNLPANHRASECALERCLEGFAVRDGHKSAPSRELICPGGPWKADSGAR